MNSSSKTKRKNPEKKKTESRNTPREPSSAVNIAVDDSSTVCTSPVSQEALDRRRARFAIKQNTFIPTPDQSSTEPIVGTCMVVEKAYFRLTTRPIASDIRPESVLKQAFKRLKSLWKSHYDRSYVMDQMKAIRQDLVIQHIHNEFAIKVYEKNARMSLEVGDLNEFNQCQSMLAVLYQTQSSKHSLEFLAYSLIYDSMMHNTMDLNRHLRHAHDYLTHKHIRHALFVVSAIRSCEYAYYCRLLEAAPSGSHELMAIHLPAMQRRMMKLTLASAMPSLSVSLLATILEMSEKDTQKLLSKYQITFNDRVEIIPNRVMIQRIPF